MKKQFKHLSMLLIIAVVTAFSLTITSCGSDSDKDEPSGGGGSSSNNPLVGTWTMQFDNGSVHNHGLLTLMVLED